jgi:hypothetical protein
MLAPCSQPRSNAGTWPLRRGTPVGASHYVREYVRNKCGNICKHVAKMRVVCADRLLVPTFEFLHEHVSVIPVMQCYSRQHGNMLRRPNTHWPCPRRPTDRKRGAKFSHRLKVQSPHHEGGYAITPTAAFGLAAFYSATSKFVTLLARLPHGDAWVRDGQVIAVHDTWSNSQLQALVKANARLIQEYKCAERHSQDPAPVAPAAAQAPKANTPLLIPPLNHTY